MKTELSAVPAIHLGENLVVPARRTWDLRLTDLERGALDRVAKALAETPGAFPLDAEAVRVLTGAVEAVQLVAGREERVERPA